MHPVIIYILTMAFDLYITNQQTVEYEVTFKKCFVFMNHLKMATDRGRNM
jgi:hypothetical protein